LPKDALKPGTKPPDEFNVVVEISRGSKIKYEIDRKIEVISVDRTLFPAFFYPYNDGFMFRCPLKISLVSLLECGDTI